MYHILPYCRTVLLCVTLSSSIHGLRLMSANVSADAAEHTTFAHSLGCSVVTPSGTLCVGAAQHGAGAYTIAKLMFDQEHFVPLVAPTRFLDQRPSVQQADTKQRAANPLYNAIITHMDLFSIYDTCA